MNNLYYIFVYDKKGYLIFTTYGDKIKINKLLGQNYVIGYTDNHKIAATIYNDYKKEVLQW